MATAVEPQAAPQAAPQAQDLARDPIAAMEATIAQTLKQTPAAQPDEGGGAQGDQPRDAKTGKFLPGVPKADQGAVPGTVDPSQVPLGGQSDGGNTEGGEVPAGAPSIEGSEGAPVALPEGYVEAPVLPEDRVKGWKVRDAEGEIAPPDLTWDINTSAGVRQLTTDKLVNYAQMGVYNHEREQRAQQAFQHVQQVQQENQQLRRTVEQQQQERDALMLSDEAYLAARAQFDAENTPQARADRAQAEVRQAREHTAVVQVAAAGQQFFTGVVTPAIETIVKALPSVTADEISARLFNLTEHLRVSTAWGAIYPTTAYETIKQALLNDVVPYVQQLHEHRAVEGQKPNQEAEANAKKARAEAEAAKVRAQKARRQASTGTRPLGTGQSAGGTGRPDPAKVRNNKDAEAAVIGGTLAALRAG